MCMDQCHESGHCPFHVKQTSPSPSWLGNCCKKLCCALLSAGWIGVHLAAASCSFDSMWDRGGPAAASHLQLMSLWPLNVEMDLPLRKMAVLQTRTLCTEETKQKRRYADNGRTDQMSPFCTGGWKPPYSRSRAFIFWWGILSSQKG